MLKRIITGAALIVAVTGFFLLRLVDRALFEILIWFLAVMGSFEIARAFDGRMHRAQKWAAVFLSALFSPAYFLFKFSGVAAVAIISLAVQLSLTVLCYGKARIGGAGYALLAGYYPALLLTTMSAANFMGDYSTAALVMIFAVAPFADTFAYFTGSLFKGPKLCPAISPKKTVSGGIGGILGGIIGAVAVYFAVGALGRAVPEWWFCIIVGFVGAVLTEFGDLAESAIKREVGIKDSGKLLPGHGGIMDRIDGILFACPFIYLCFASLTL